MARVRTKGPALRACPRARGFTLVEMMIVVIIMAILAVLAVVGYRTLITSSHLSEATHMIGSIRVAQEGYHSETLTYANVSAGPTAYYPQAAPTGHLLTQWGAPCTNCADVDWSVLPLHVDGPVMFGYATIASSGGQNAQPPAVTVNGKALTYTAPSEWYFIAASCDMNADGDSANTNVYSFSWTNQLFVDAEGQ